MSNYQSIQNVNDFQSLIEYLRDELEWDFQAEDIEDLTFDYAPEELGVDKETADKIKEIRQLRPMAANQPWGIFLIDFGARETSISAMRQLLRGLVRRKRESANDADRQRFNLGDLLFILTSENFDQFNFAYFRGSDVARAALSIFGWQTGETHLRTLCEHNLPKLKFPANPNDGETWLKQWREAFDVERVTNRFFADYERIFRRVNQEAQTSIGDEEKARLFTQRLFNRLMFIYFLQKKEWLTFDGDVNYLRRLFTEAESAGENFFRERLYWVFFHGLGANLENERAHGDAALIERRGAVPYLNGGLFEIEKDGFDERGKIALENSLFADILDVFERYNFTVEESTPMDVQVAVDPEMLGKVFEELVTGRHESGSYYTPRQIVSFMCRESLKHYLRNQIVQSPVQSPNFSLPPRRASRSGQHAEAWTLNDEIAEFVDDGNGENLQNPELILDALKQIRICDPACGSGAYLLGMMQELLRLRDALFTAKRLGDASLYNRKREIIENNIYGVDKDRFAVQIASLRLWLSLAIESKEPRPLPNLKYKIGCGDALLAPLENDLQPDLHRRALIEQFRQRKTEYASASDYTEKSAIDREIERLRIEIAQSLHHLPEPPKPHEVILAESNIQPLREKIKRLMDSTASDSKSQAEKFQKELNKLLAQIEQWKQQIEIKDYTPDFFDWEVEFAEIFVPVQNPNSNLPNVQSPNFSLPNVQSPNFSLPRPRSVAETPPNTSVERSGDNSADEARRKHAEAWTLNKGGFDIVLANPPYIRQELLGREYKENGLKPNFAEVYSGTADIYVYFFARANAMLKPSGVGCFISSNKWLRAGYGEKLRQFLLDRTKFHLVVDFGELPVFNAATFPAIFLWQNAERKETTTNWAVVKDLSACYAEGVREHIARLSETLPASQFGIGKSRLASIHTTNLRETMEKSGQRLGVIAKDLIFRGIVTGLNEAFIVNKETAEEILTKDNKSIELLRPLMAGDDVRRFEIYYRDSYLLYVRRNEEIKKFPAILQHLSKFEDKLSNKAGTSKWYELQASPGGNKAKVLDLPKIAYPEIGKESRFVMETKGFFPSDTVHIIAIQDWFLFRCVKFVKRVSIPKKVCSVLGDEDKAGRLRFKPIYMENLPIPNASDDEREAIAKLAKETQNLHTERRGKVEQFLRDIGTSAAQSSSRNVLEKPWELTETEFARRVKSELLVPTFRRAKEETHLLTEQTVKIEHEIDSRVAELYGVSSESKL